MILLLGTGSGIAPILGEPFWNRVLALRNRGLRSMSSLSPSCHGLAAGRDALAYRRPSPLIVFALGTREPQSNGLPIGLEARDAGQPACRHHQGIQRRCRYPQDPYAAGLFLRAEGGWPLGEVPGRHGMVTLKSDRCSASAKFHNSYLSKERLYHEPKNVEKISDANGRPRVFTHRISNSTFYIHVLASCRTGHHRSRSQRAATATMSFLHQRMAARRDLL